MTILRKHISHQLICILGIILFGGLFSACDVLGGVYDDTLDGTDNEGSTTPESSTDADGSHQFYKDATSFTRWIYVNLHTSEPTFTLSDINIADKSESGAPLQWDFAIHHYDVKTNGGAVLMTPYHTIAEAEAAGLPTSGNWIADTYSDQSIIVDMSRMMEGIFGYAPGYRNSEASRWMDVDISIMPPNYTMHDNVMLLRMSDGTIAAFQLTDFVSTDKYHVKGWITVKYKYPVFN